MFVSGRWRRNTVASLLTVFLAVVLSGCVFLPSLAAGGQQPLADDPGSVRPTVEVDSDAFVGDDADDEAQASELPYSPTEEDPQLRRGEVTEWPESIPMPDGEPSPYSNTPDFYLVPADRDAFDAYVEELMALPDVEVVDTSGSSYAIAWLYIGEYDVFVMFHEDSDQMSVSLSYR